MLLTSSEHSGEISQALSFSQVLCWTSASVVTSRYLNIRMQCDELKPKGGGLKSALGKGLWKPDQGGDIHQELKENKSTSCDKGQDIFMKKNREETTE